MGLVFYGTDSALSAAGATTANDLGVQVPAQQGDFNFMAEASSSSPNPAQYSIPIAGFSINASLDFGRVLDDSGGVAYFANASGAVSGLGTTVSVAGSFSAPGARSTGP